MKSAWLGVVLTVGCQRDAGAPPPPPTTGDAIDRAATWLAAFPDDKLRFDAAIGLHAIRAAHDSDAVRRAEARARAVADRDPDNPLRRAFDDTARASTRATSGWALPAAGARVNVNRVLGEALHCRENGLRPQTVAYATGAMRDGGGYQTAHALWALSIARERGCLVDFATVARPLIDELRAAESPDPGTEALAIDLFAERLLMLELAGEHGPPLDAWADHLARAQAADGGFGQLAPDEDPYHRYHATLAATWALAIR